MSWLLFLDESGHDHNQCPYEVRGGVAVHASKVWPLLDSLQSLEVECFGTSLDEFGVELKGASLLKRKRFKHAQQMDSLTPSLRRRLCQSFLTRTFQKLPPTREELTAYGQACILMAEGIFERLDTVDAQIFAAITPTDVRPPDTPEADTYLRKDKVFLLERFFYFLEEQKEHGLLVFDETDKTSDKRFVRRLRQYFSRTAMGRLRTTWIVPAPLFVASDMNPLVQAADIAIYCINWGFRLPSRGLDAPARPEIANTFGYRINRLQHQGEGSRDGQTFRTFGIVYVPDPYTSRKQD